MVIRGANLEGNHSCESSGQESNYVQGQIRLYKSD